jgi:hypothetical protein
LSNSRAFILFAWCLLTSQITSKLFILKVVMGKMSKCETSYSVDWLPDRLTDRPTDWLTDRPTDLPTDLPTDWPTDWMTDWPTEWLTDRLNDWLTGWEFGMCNCSGSVFSDQISIYNCRLLSGCRDSAVGVVTILQSGRPRNRVWFRIGTIGYVFLTL